MLSLKLIILENIYLLVGKKSIGNLKIGLKQGTKVDKNNLEAS